MSYNLDILLLGESIYFRGKNTNINIETDFYKLKEDGYLPKTGNTSGKKRKC